MNLKLAHSELEILKARNETMSKQSKLSPEQNLAVLSAEKMEIEQQVGTSWVFRSSEKFRFQFYSLNSRVQVLEIERDLLNKTLQSR